MPDSRPIPPKARRAALVIALTYLIFALAWILLTGAIAPQPPSSPDARQPASHEILKGCLFVGLTAILLYVLIFRYYRKLQSSQNLMQQRLEGIAKQYQMLFQSSPLALFIWEPVSREILAANDATLPLFGYSREELLAMTFHDLLVEEDRAKGIAAAHDPRAPRAPVPWQCRRRDRRMIVVETAYQSVEFDGRPAEIARFIDITERLRAERALQQYRSQLEQRVADRTAELSLTNRKLRAEADERHRIEADLRAATAAAEAANNAKSTFLANTSHEIRTPLTSILGYADLLNDPDLSEEVRVKHLDVVQQNARHLLVLIDDLLDLSRAEMGKVRVVLDDHSPREIARQAVDLLRPRAQEKLLDLALDLADDIPPTIHTDGVRLRQILLNLLSNAIKFTPEGRVSLTVRRKETSDWFAEGNDNAGSADDSGSPVIRFEVADTGIGMEKENLHSIFEPFYQVDQGATRRYGGTGLGLAISRQLTSQMGGTLLVQSEIGRGSTFTLELPLHAASAAPAPNAGATQPTPARAARTTPTLAGTILLAEDNAAIRRLVEEYLRRAGARVITAADGAQALDHVEKSLHTPTNGDKQTHADNQTHATPPANASHRIDLVLLDLHMPVLDGENALHRMRRAGYRGPIVGLTADYAEKTIEAWTREGWDAMAAKPIDRQAFIPLLARMLQQFETKEHETKP